MVIQQVKNLNRSVLAEIWDRIETQEHIIEEWSVEDPVRRDGTKMIRALDSLKNELDYFVYLTEKGEIKDSVVREYYRKRLLNIFVTARFINKQYPESQYYSGTQEILNLIEKYHKLTDKMKEYREEFAN